jgi:mannitol/fructose-specific phosphotransferase system IIA component (Ntr-type)
VDFDAPDGKPARLIFLLLTPTRDSGSQLDLLAEIGRTFRQEHLRAKVLSARSATEFLALMKTQGE